MNKYYNLLTVTSYSIIHKNTIVVSPNSPKKTKLRNNILLYNKTHEVSNFFYYYYTFIKSTKVAIICGFLPLFLRLTFRQKVEIHFSPDKI